MSPAEMSEAMAQSTLKWVRPQTSRFTPSALADRWDELARQRRPGFDWDGSSYMACGRSLALDTASLVAHKDALKMLVEVAPTAFPSHPCLKSVLLGMHRKLKIFGETTKVERVSSEGADRWRIMCRHLYDIKKSGIEALGTYLNCFCL